MHCFIPSRMRILLLLLLIGTATSLISLHNEKAAASSSCFLFVSAGAWPGLPVYPIDVPYYSPPIVTIGDASSGPITARVETPAILNGTFVHSFAPFTGTMLINKSCVEGEDCRVRYTLHIPNSWYDTSGNSAYACAPTLTNLTSDSGDKFDSHTLILALRDGPCNFAEKGLAVQNVGLGGVMFQGTGALSITLGKLNVSSVPLLYIQKADGLKFRDYLTKRNARRNGNLAYGPEYDDTIVIAFRATGPMVPAEKAALKQVVQTILNTGAINDAKMLAENSALRSWSDAVKNPDLDPCLNRITGIWCENGHLTLIWLVQSPQYLTGVLDPAIGLFPYLRLIEMSSQNIKSLPDSMCNLTKLYMLSFGTQSDGTSSADVKQGLTYLPECVGTIPALLALNVPNNRLKSIPSTLVSAPGGFQFISIKNNLITTLPANFSTNWRNMYSFDLSLNQIAQPLPSFKNWPYLSIIGLSRNQFTSVFNSTDYLDGLWLTVCDLSFNSLTILPDLKDSQNPPVGTWISLQFQNNMFQGGIPLNWGLPNQLPSITQIKLSNNRLTGPFDGFLNMKNPTLIQLNNNSINFTGDVGQWMSYWIPSTLLELDIDDNKISGYWSAGYTYRNKNFTTLSMARNLMNSLPTDIFSNHISQWDFSYNRIEGAFPTSTVPAATPAYLNLVGNPGLTYWPLPSWLVQSGDPLQGGGVVLDNSYACATLKNPTVPTFQISVDPQFTKYNGCACIRGKFGFPPLCQPIPERAEISPVYGFSSDEVGANYLKMINTTSSTPATVTGNATLVSSSPVIVKNSTSTNNTSSSTTNITTSTSTSKRTSRQATIPSAIKVFTPLQPPSLSNISYTMPPGFTDQFYGSQRLTLGVSTTFEINIRNLFLDTHDELSGGNNGSSIVELKDDSGNRSYIDSTTISGDYDIDRYQPVRMITIQLHISRALFTSPSDILFVYEGDASLSGIRVADIVGTDQVPDPPTATSGDSSSITLTPDYIQKYDKQMSAIINRGLIEIKVMNNAAAIHFSSRASQGQFFFATYTYKYSCHPTTEFFLDDSNGVYRCIAQLPKYTIASPIRVAVWTVAGVCLLWIIINMISVIVKYDSPLYRAASRPFLLIMLFFLGAMSFGAMLYAAVPDGDSNGNMDTARAICIGRAWLLCLPLAGVIAILFGRANRVEQIFGSMSILKVKSVTDMSVYQYIIGFCGVEVVLLLIYSILPLSQPKLSRGQGGLNDHMVVSCSIEGSGGNIWIGVQIAFLAILLSLTTFIGFKTRNIPSAFNESHHILTSVLFLMFFSALIVPLDFYISELPSAAVLLQGLGQSFLVALMTTIFFAPKLWIVWTVDEKVQRSMMTLTMSAISSIVHDSASLALTPTPGGVKGGPNQISLSSSGKVTATGGGSGTTGTKPSSVTSGSGNSAVTFNGNGTAGPASPCGVDSTGKQALPSPHRQASQSLVRTPSTEKTNYGFITGSALVTAVANAAAASSPKGQHSRKPTNAIQASPTNERVDLHVNLPSPSGAITESEEGRQQQHLEHPHAHPSASSSSANDTKPVTKGDIERDTHATVFHIDQSPEDNLAAVASSADPIIGAADERRPTATTANSSLEQPVTPAADQQNSALDGESSVSGEESA